jgi:hypothetical protein
MDNEDFCCKNSKVLISNVSPFKDSMSELSAQIGFKLEYDYTNNKDSWWLRDSIIPLKGEIYSPNIDNASLYKDQRLYVEKYAKQSDKLYYSLSGNQLHHAQTNTTSHLKIGNKQIKKFTNIAIEGGNIFSAINGKGHNFLIIGENAILDTAAYIKHNDPHYKTNLPANQYLVNNYYAKKGFDYDFVNLRYLAKKRIAETFGFSPNDLIIIPQWAYHIDLQMSYVGYSQFILNTFELPQINEITNEDIDYDFDMDDYFGIDPKETGLGPMFAPKIQQTFNCLNEKFGDKIVNNIEKKLIKKGFQVYKVIGTAFCNTGNPLNIPYCCNSKYQHGGSASLLMNGITVFSNKYQKRYFITANATVDNGLKKVFSKNLTDKCGVEVVFIDINKNMNLGHIANNDPNRTLDFVRIYEGSVRCQTAIIPTMPYLRRVNSYNDLSIICQELN